MARSKQDELKRKAAQAVNHIGAAVLDVNEIYKPFKEASRDEAAQLEAIMQTIAAGREALLIFARNAWYLDEDQLIHWM